MMGYIEAKLLQIAENIFKIFFYALQVCLITRRQLWFSFTLLSQVYIRVSFHIVVHITSGDEFFYQNQKLKKMQFSKDDKKSTKHCLFLLYLFCSENDSTSTKNKCF